MTARIVLTVGCIGKSTVSKLYDNVFDYDSLTLSYKYDRTGYEDLTDEEFKGLPNRKIKENWFENYTKDFDKLLEHQTNFAFIEGEDRAIITGWLQQDFVDYLISKGYEFDIVLVNPDSEISIYRERSINRGNSDSYFEHLRDYYRKTFELYTIPYYLEKIKRVYVLDKPCQFSDFLVTTGSSLFTITSVTDTSYQLTDYTYIDLVSDRIKQYYPNIGKKLNSLYSLLVFNALSSGQVITNEMIHDAWSLFAKKGHPMRIPYDNLPDDIKDLDTPYCNVLNDVVDIMRHLKSSIRLL